MDWLTSNAWWIRLLVEIGIFAGVTWLVYINRYYYNQSIRAKDDQITLKDEQIALLERTQVENFVAKLEAQKKFFNEMEEGYVRSISEIKAAKEAKDHLIAELKAMLKKLETTAETTTLEASGHISAFARGYALSRQSALSSILLQTKDKE